MAAGLSVSLFARPSRRFHAGHVLFFAFPVPSALGHSPNDLRIERLPEAQLTYSRESMPPGKASDLLDPRKL